MTAASRRLVSRLCDRCGAQFNIRQDRASQRYCSHRCAAFARPYPDATTRFWSYVERVDSGCWPWKGSIEPNTYGQFTERSGHPVRAHRYALAEAMGMPIPDGFMALHTCDLRPCVRNDEVGTYEVNGVLFPRWGHLWLGTNEDNVADMIAKGRDAREHRSGRRLHPERYMTNRPRKLSEQQVIDIRRRYAAGGVTQLQLAEDYGITKHNVSAIIRRLTWQHIDDTRLVYVELRGGKQVA